MNKQPNMVDRIQKVAYEDPAHRKIFIHGLGWDTNTETLSKALKQYIELIEATHALHRVQMGQIYS